MKNIKDIRTSSLLLIGLGFVFVLIITLSAVAWNQTDKMALRTENMYNHPLLVRKTIAQFENSILEMRVEFRNILLAKNEKRWNRAEQNYQIAKLNAEGQFNTLYDNYLGDLKDIDSLNISFLLWNMMQEENINKSITAQNYEAQIESLLDGDLKISRDLLLKRINTIEDFASNKADQFYNESVVLNQQLNRQFLVFVIITLIIFLVIIYYLSRTINIPLKEITRATTLFRKGSLSVRSSYTSVNEFGHLSTAFNEMADIVESEFILKNDSAKLAEIMLNFNDAKLFCTSILKNLLELTHSQMGIVFL